MDIVVKVLLYWFVRVLQSLPKVSMRNERIRSKRGVFLVWWQLIVLCVQTLERFLAVLGEVWPTDRCDCAGEKSWLPLFLRRLSLCSLLPLLLFYFCLEVRRQSILLAYYGIRDTVPELEGLIGKLLLERWDDLGYGVKRVEVDDEVLLLLDVRL